MPHIRRDMIDYYEIPVSQINNIKNGADWTTKEGDVIPNARLVMPAATPRSYAYCSDTRFVPGLAEKVKGLRCFIMRVLILQRMGTGLNSIITVRLDRLQL